nr:hypothetical protein [uncultured Pedobacter sp.]
MEKQEFYLHNENTKISYDLNEKVIKGSDFTDQHNDPRFFSTSKRGLAKAWKILHDDFNEDMTMYEATRLLRSANIRVHTYCGLD